MRLLLCAATLAALFAFAAPAQAAPMACFDWVCDTSNGQCDFDASCSDDDALDFRWTWGDGSPMESHWDDPLASHTYAYPQPNAYVTLSVGYRFIGYYDVTCNIQIRNQVGPPQPYFSGRCSL